MMGIDKIKLFISLSWRNLWRNYRRTLITFSSISVGVWSMIVLASFMDAWAMSTFQASINTLTGHAQIHAKNYLDDPGVDHLMRMPEGRLLSLLNSDEVKQWSSRIRVPAIVQSERETAPLTLLGIHPQKEQGLSFIADAVNSGDYFKDNNANGILLGAKLAKRLRTGINKRVVLISQSKDGGIAERGFRVVGLFKVDQQNIETQFAFITQSTAQKMLGTGQRISEISFKLNNINRLDAFIKKYQTVSKNQGVNNEVKSWAELEPFTKAILELSSGSIALFTVIMFIVIAFGLVNTLLMAVYERTREFGLLQALGMKPVFILLLILIESVFLMGFGVLIGYIFAVLTIELFADGLNLGMLAEGAAMFGAGRVLYPQLNGLQSVYIALFLWSMGVLVSLYPAWRASKDVPVESINKAY